MAEQGREALRLLQIAVSRRVPYRLIVTDLFMPEMDGFQLVASVRADPGLCAVAVVMLSSAIRRGDAERARSLGVSSLLLEPAGRTELVTRRFVAGPEPGAPADAEVEASPRWVVSDARRTSRSSSPERSSGEPAEVGGRP